MIITLSQAKKKKMLLRSLHTFKCCCHGSCTRKQFIQQTNLYASLAQVSHPSGQGSTEVMKSVLNRDQLLFTFHNNEQLVDHVVRNVIYEDDQVVAFNKPYGVAMQNNNLQNNQKDIALSNILPVLQDRWRLKELKFRTILPWNYTGVILMTKRESVFKKMANYFLERSKARNPFKEYLAICVGTPPPMKSDIDRLIFQNQVHHDTPQLVVVENPRTYKNKKKGEVLPIYNYLTVVRETLASQSFTEDVSVSLVKLRTLHNNKSSLQCYMAHCLCPVLGDHLYSQRINFLCGAPLRVLRFGKKDDIQHLPPQIKCRLGLKDVTTDDLPLHIHNYGVIIPKDVFSKRERSTHKIIVSPPDKFNTTLKKLNISYEKFVDHS